ncbi:MAG: hypothetical protein ACE14P_01660 [Methanotrichaceae archaeon]
MSRVLVGAVKAFAATFLLVIILAVFATGSQAADKLEGYKPAHALGSGEDDWWTGYPPQSSGSGTLVVHPKWVQESLKDKPVLILDHSSSCTSCAVQKANIEKALASYGKDVTYYDLMADELDKRGIEILSTYGITGNYVPTTVFITLIKSPDGKVSVAWHTAEDAMSESDIVSYLKDAIYYHQQNASGWSK